MVWQPIRKKAVSRMQRKGKTIQKRVEEKTVEASRYYMTREEAIEAMTHMINMIYDNNPREFEINISAGVDKIPMIEVEFEGAILNMIPGAKE